MISIDQIKPNVRVVYNKNAGFVPMKAGYILTPIPDRPLSGFPIRLTGKMRDAEIMEIDSEGNTKQQIQVECRAVIHGYPGTFWMDLDNVSLLN